MSFANLKKKTSNLAKLQKQVESKASGGNSRDERVFKHTYDKETCIGSALIRILPRYDEEGEFMLPWASWTEYSFKTQTGNYWNRSLTNLSKEDPVAILNKAAWAKITDRDGPDAAEARKRNIKKKYVCNIVVINDPENSENNGKVFLYEFGPSIQEKFEKALFPEYEDQAALDFYSWDEGANFRIRTKKGKNGWMSYEDSAFEGITALAEGRQEVQEKLYNSMYDLKEFEADDKYKEFDVLKKEMVKVLGARYIAGIMGETYNPAQDAEAGGNPFGGAQSASGEANPFGNSESASETNPLIEKQPEPAASKESEKVADPFAKTTTGSDQVDPFANATQSNDDPFANLTL